MSKQINENSNFIKENLEKIWGENQAEYFSNPARLVNRTDDANEATDRTKVITNRIENQRKSSKQNPTATASSQKGLYAFTIWENIREDTKKKLRHFNLEKELQVSNYIFFFFFTNFSFQDNHKSYFSV